MGFICSFKSYTGSIISIINGVYNFLKSIGGIKSIGRSFFRVCVDIVLEKNRNFLIRLEEVFFLYIYRSYLFDGLFIIGFYYNIKVLIRIFLGIEFVRIGIGYVFDFR